jgi:hypothetical protein
MLDELRLNTSTEDRRQRKERNRVAQPRCDIADDYDRVRGDDDSIGSITDKYR